MHLSLGIFSIPRLSIFRKKVELLLIKNLTLTRKNLLEKL